MTRKLTKNQIDGIREDVEGGAIDDWSTGEVDSALLELVHDLEAAEARIVELEETFEEHHYECSSCGGVYDERQDPVASSTGPGYDSSDGLPHVLCSKCDLGERLVEIRGDYDGSKARLEAEIERLREGAEEITLIEKSGVSDKEKVELMREVAQAALAPATQGD
jgi:rubredoxin